MLRIEYAFIMHDYESPFGGKLPFVLDVGQKTDLSFDPEACKFLKENYTHIGISNTLGTHWCSRRDMTKAREEFANKAWIKESPG